MTTTEPTNIPASDLLAQFAAPAPPPPQLTKEQKLLEACSQVLRFMLENGASPNDLLCRKLAKLNDKSQPRRINIVAQVAVNVLRSDLYAKGGDEENALRRGELIGLLEGVLGFGVMSDQEIDDFIKGLLK